MGPHATPSPAARGFTDIVDVTSQVQAAVRESGLRDGIVVVHVPGSTAGVTTLEYEPGRIADLKALFERLAPTGASYQHDLTWGDGNGFAHVRASLGPSLSLPSPVAVFCWAPGSRSP